MNITDGIEHLFSQNTDPYQVTAQVTGNGTVDAASSVTSGNTDSTLFAPKNELGKMDFLKLLTTQLQFQDPLEPMENSEFISQLAQFSALEGTNNIEQAISDLNNSYQDSVDVQTYSALSMTNASAVSLIGKRIRIGETSVKYIGIPGEDSKIRVHLGDNDSATVKILDRDGETVRTMAAGNKNAENSVELTWDGKNDAGEYAQAGTYFLYVEGQETDTALYCYIEEMVQGVRYTADGPLIKIGGKELPLGNILDISMAQSNTSNNSGLMNTNSLSLLGKTVKYQKSALTYTPVEGNHVDINADLGGNTSAVVEVKDIYGNIVYTFKIEADSGTTAHAKLDCTDFNGNGPYTLSLAGNNAGFFFDEGEVKGISIVDGVTMLKVNGITVALSEIYEISTV